MFARGIIRLFGMALVVFCLSAALLPSQQVEAESGTVCTNKRVDLGDRFNYNVANDGTNLAWTRNNPAVSPGPDILFYNAKNHSTINLTDSIDSYVGSPHTSDNKVVWTPIEDVYLNDVYLYDVLTGLTTNLSNTPDLLEELPWIDGTKVVWQAHKEDEYLSSEVYLHDLTSEVTVNLSDNVGIDDYFAQIDGEWVVWISDDQEGNYELHSYNLITEKHTVRPLASGNFIDIPQLKNNWVAFAVWENWSSEEIYLYDLNTDTVINISNSLEKEVHISLNDDYLLWDIHWYDTTKNKIQKTYFLDLETQTQIELNADAASALAQFEGLKVGWAISDGTHDQIFFYNNKQLHQITGNIYLDRFETPAVHIMEHGVAWIQLLHSPNPNDHDTQQVYISTCGEPPTITDQPDSLTINANESATLSVAATGDGSLAYQWYAGNSGDTSSLIPGAISASYTTPPLNENARYWVRVNGTFGSADSMTAIITVPQETPEPTTETPEPTTETPEPTTVTPEPAPNLLTNGGFEVDADGDKLPDGWKGKKTTNPKADKLKCDKVDKTFAHSAPCAFMFKGNPDGSKSKLLQKMTDTSAFVHGATVTLSAWVDPRSAAIGTRFAQAKIVYTDGSKDKLKLSIPAAEGYTQQTDSVLLDLTDRTIKAVKVVLYYDRPKGKFFVDDVALTVESGVGALPLP